MENKSSRVTNSNIDHRTRDPRSRKISFVRFATIDASLFEIASMVRVSVPVSSILNTKDCPSREASREDDFYSLFREQIHPRF